MEKKLIYLDQNVVGLHSDGRIDLRKNDGDLQWVYSKQHFSEFRRSKRCEEFLNTLEEIEARLIELQLNEKFQIQDSCIIHASGLPRQHFEKFKEAICEVNFDPAVMSAPIAWLNGNRDLDALKNHVNQLSSMTEDMLKEFDLKIEDIPGGEGFRELLEESVKKLSEVGGSIESIRSKFGARQGFSDYSEKENPLREIWQVIESVLGGMSSDQFFGFRAWDGSKSTSKYEAVIACCSVLDVIGFHAEKKSRKISKVPNVQSDAAHIAFGIFCFGLVSADQRLCRRAEAIYKYADIRTQVFEVGV